MKFAWLILAGAALLAEGQEQTLTPQQKAMEAMRASVEKMQASIDVQRQSVRRQVQSARQLPPEEAQAAPRDDFYTVPWPEPLAMPAAASLNDEDCPAIPQHSLAAYIKEAADREGLSPDLLRAVINKESSYHPCAVSNKGAMGLMQLMPDTADQLRVRDPFNAKQNIDGGSRLLRSLLDRYGNDLPMALGAYNAGAGAVDRSGGIPAYPETQRYVNEIMGQLGFQ